MKWKSFPFSLKPQDCHLMCSDYNSNAEPSTVEQCWGRLKAEEEDSSCGLRRAIHCADIWVPAGQGTGQCVDSPSFVLWVDTLIWPKSKKQCKINLSWRAIVQDLVHFHSTSALASLASFQRYLHYSLEQDFSSFLFLLEKRFWVAGLGWMTNVPGS